MPQITLFTKQVLLTILVTALLMTTIFLSGCVSLTGQSGGIVCHKVEKQVKGCDQIEGCTCLHKSWGGLGACDSCECEECLAS
jgi:hypothetical protein